METPQLSVNELVTLRPVNRRILPEVMEAYHEDPIAARSALPWLKEGEEARRRGLEIPEGNKVSNNKDNN